MISKASAQWSIFEKVRKELLEMRTYGKGIILDIGCGTKPFHEGFSSHSKDYIGVDLPTMIKRQIAKHGLTI